MSERTPDPEASLDRPKRAQRMVGWYDPRQLLNTGIEVFISTLFGRHSDHRLMEAVITPRHQPPKDYTCDHVLGERYDESKPDPKKPRTEIWMDYLADTGDGWDSTYSMAYTLARPVINVEHKGVLHGTERGSLLILGGDEVYPTANRKEYEERLLLPFMSAMPNTVTDHPHVFAIPGNHDWYDSLVSFTRVFIGKDWFGGWFAAQDRSYFALKLPHGWWLLGVDTQLGSDIDALQVEYFEKAAKQMGPTDRVILCCAEPQWIYEKFYSKYDAHVYNDSNLAYLNRKVLGDRVRVFLAGDLHHYRRHANDKGVQKITCGGGGAFLHPRHAPDANELPGDKPFEEVSDGSEVTPPGSPYRLQAAYPDVNTSRKLTWRNLLFPWFNPWFGVFIGVIYFVAAWAFALTNSYINVESGKGYLLAVAKMLIDRPAASFWAVVMVVAWVFFTDTHSKWYQRIAGSLHGVAHLAAIVLLGWWAIHLADHLLGPMHERYDGWRFAIKSLTILLGGGLLGSLIMGLYLFISLNVFGRHYNEAFSSLAIADYKCFLRFHVDPQGELTIYPMGIGKVPRKWVKQQPGTYPAWEPAHGSVRVHLMEEPVKVARG